MSRSSEILENYFMRSYQKGHHHPDYEHHKADGKDHVYSHKIGHDTYNIHNHIGNTESIVTSSNLERTLDKYKSRGYIVHK